MAKTKTRSRKKNEPKPLFDPHVPGLIWVYSGERLTDNVVYEDMVRSGFRPTEDTSWSIGVPRIVQRAGHHAVYTDGHVSIPHKQLTALTARPTTAEAAVSWMERRITDWLAEPIA